MSYLASNLKKLRKAKRLSQSQFAKIFGLTRATVGAYEEGRAEPKLDKLIEIAKYFGLTVDQLVSKKLTVNEIYHYDKKISIIDSIDFVPLSEKQNFINHLKNQNLQNFKFKQIYIPSLIADLAIETDSFITLSKSILFLKKITKPQDKTTWTFTIKNNDYFFQYLNLKNLTNWQEIWEIIAILTTNLNAITEQNLQLQRIETKLDLILNNMQKISK